MARRGRRHPAHARADQRRPRNRAAVQSRRPRPGPQPHRQRDSRRRCLRHQLPKVSWGYRCRRGGQPRLRRWDRLDARSHRLPLRAAGRRGGDGRDLVRDRDQPDGRSRKARANRGTDDRHSGALAALALRAESGLFAPTASASCRAGEGCRHCRHGSSCAVLRCCGRGRLLAVLLRRFVAILGVRGRRRLDHGAGNATNCRPQLDQGGGR